VLAAGSGDTLITGTVLSILTMTEADAVFPARSSAHMDLLASRW
jgi:hypothetical protein